MCLLVCLLSNNGSTLFLDINKYVVGSGSRKVTYATFYRGEKPYSSVKNACLVVRSQGWLLVINNGSIKKYIQPILLINILNAEILCTLAFI